MSESQKKQIYHIFSPFTSVVRYVKLEDEIPI